jgi:Tat protein secretion system quality control protein TatD with DNase activity
VDCAEHACAAGELEFGDTHGHLCSDRADEWADALARNMAANRVRKAVLTGAGLLTPDQDERVLRACERHSSTFIPFLCQIDPDESSSKRYIEEQLARGPWGGVGEIFLDTCYRVYAKPLPLSDGSSRPFRYPVPKDGPDCEVFHFVFQKCAEVGKPILIHCETALPLWKMLKKHRQTRVIWAHADYVTPPEDVRHLLNAFPLLTCEFGPGLRNAPINPVAEENMPSVLRRNAEWSRIARDFPERLTMGTDIIQWPVMANYGRLFEFYRNLLQDLPPESARKIAYGNFQRLFGI